MSDTISAQEAAELRRRLDEVAPPRPMFLSPEPPDPNSWAGQQGAIQEHKRQERLAAARIAHEKMLAEETAKQARRAAIDREVAELTARREALEDEREEALAPARARFREQAVPIEAKYQRQTAPIDEQVAQLRSERKALE
jgi:hypothetical protein